MLQPPTGTVTFLFTDIEGSTKHWERSPDAMRTALACHDEIVQASVEANGGTVFKTIGDAFCAAFATTSEAIAAALDAQLSLFAEHWEIAPPVRARMAVHSGAAEQRGGDYFGQPLNRVARLLSAGHGGQILISAATQELVRDTLPFGCSLIDLGDARLKDLTRPERVFQLVHPDLPSEFPPLRSLNSGELPNNLPQQTTSFIGREKEISDIKALLPKTRLLTLVGAGGAGKTRLALQAAADLLEGDGGGVWLVELATLTDPALVAGAVAQVLGVKEAAGQPVHKTLTESLKDKSLLIVLDNCEHLLDACCSLATDLLRACPGAHLLATSREPLGASGEQVYRVPSLSVPRQTASGARPAYTAATLSQFESVRLFIERAKAVQAAFAVTDQNAPAVAQLCYRLDGIPLAIELAAARVRSMAVEQVNDRLGSRFKLLTGGSRMNLPRQQTLRALIDWSYDLLSGQEKAMLALASVFAGGWTLEAAEAVCAGGGEEDGGIEDWEVLDLLTSLVDKSLVNADDAQGAVAVRYRLMETVRQYASERRCEFVEQGSGGPSVDKASERHLEYFAGLAAQANKGMDGSESLLWIKLLSDNFENVRAAMAFALQAASVEPALRLAAEMYDFTIQRGCQSECRHWIDAALAGASDEGEIGFTKCRALIAAGNIEFSLCDWDGAEQYYRRALTIAQAQGSARLVAACLGNIASTSIQLGTYNAAETSLQECLAIYLSSGETLAAAAVYSSLGSVSASSGQLDKAVEYYESGLKIFRDTGSSGGIASMLDNIGAVYLQRKEYGAAGRELIESLRIRCATNNRHGFYSVLPELAVLASETGRHALALACAEHVRKLETEMQIAGSEHAAKIARALQAAAEKLSPGEARETALQVGREDTVDFCRRLVDSWDT